TSALYTLSLHDALPIYTVFAQRHLVLGAAVEEIEDRARQAPARELAQILDIDRPGEVGHIIRAALYPRKVPQCRVCSLLLLHCCYPLPGRRKAIPASRSG